MLIEFGEHFYFMVMWSKIVDVFNHITSKGNYILQSATKDKIQTYKFIKG